MTWRHVTKGHITTLTLLSIIGMLVFSFRQIKLLFHITTTELWHTNNNDQIPSIPVDNKTERQITQETNSFASTKAWSNTTIVAHRELHFRSGFCNQMMAFIAFTLNAVNHGHGQVMLESMSMKDTYGTNGLISFDKIWDVPHFNSFYPKLPRIVNCDEDVLKQFNCTRNDWYWSDGWFTDRYGNNPEKECSSPYADRTFHSKVLILYMRYARGKRTGLYEPADGSRHPAEILMHQVALRPHPDLKKMVDLSMSSLTNSHGLDTKIEFVALHARVEPDMQKHPICTDIKVLKLADIFNFLESKWPDPPAPHIFMPINRQLLEKEGQPNKKDPSRTNWIAVENLRALDEAKEKGLWNGRAKFFEFGSNALKGTVYEHRWSIAGSVLNYFISLEAKIFIGTEISTYSNFLMATRFYRGNMENYKYLPSGIHPWTPPGLKHPNGFGC